MAQNTKRINISVTQQVAGYLDLLAKQGVLGATPSEVAKAFVQQGVLSAIEKDMLPKPSH